MQPKYYTDTSKAWLAVVDHVYTNGFHAEPRGLEVLEVLGMAVEIDMEHPVVRVLERGLSYSFMAAEAVWILSGSNLLLGISPYNKRYAKYSDDGVHLNGAYGPPFVEQLPYVVHQLKQADTRQAWMTLWRPRPHPSKDIPCTVALGFQVRKGVLNCTAIMRSSDLWLGVPYDWFTFSVLAARVASLVGNLRLGGLTWFTANAHLYLTDMGSVKSVLATPTILQPSEQALLDVGWDDFYNNLCASRETPRTTIFPGL